MVHLLKHLGVGGSRADVTVNGSFLPGAEGMLQERDAQSLGLRGCVSL